MILFEFYLSSCFIAFENVLAHAEKCEHVQVISEGSRGGNLSHSRSIPECTGYSGATYVLLRIGSTVFTRVCDVSILPTIQQHPHLNPNPTTFLSTQ
jgi:hypothetical protein